MTSREPDNAYGPDEPLRLLDLFSGIGGFSLGLERTGGFKTVGFCEIEQFCRRVLAKHWPDVPCAEDITKREFQEGEADVICGGFPCQDISLAGLGAGLTGARSGLWGQLLRAIRLVQPKFAIVENVAALLGRGMGTVLGDLAEVGYDAEWHCIPASAVGAPHRRDRVWIIANPGGEQHEGRRAPLSGEIAQEHPRAYLANASQLFGDVSNDNRASRNQGEGQVSEFGNSHSSTRSEGGWWSIEPDVDRVAHGISARVDRLCGLGNAVIPQIPEMIGRAILRSIAPTPAPPVIEDNEGEGE